MTAQVNLTGGELSIGCLVGVMRQLDNMKNKRKHRYGATPTKEGPWQIHIEGACGEFAVARYLDRHWSGRLGDLHAPDIGERIQVRTTAVGGGHLPLHPDDPDDHLFVLATGTAPRFILRGWILGKSGKLQKYWSDPTGEDRWAFFVPQSVLEPIETLARELEEVHGP